MSPSARRSARSASRLALAVVALVIALVPTPASAHATLVSSTPAAGARLDALPAEARLEFSGALSAPAYVIVTAPDGSSVADGDPVVEGAVVSQTLADGPDGGYTMAYRAVSEDGHPLTGEITFTVGTGSGASAAPDAEPDAEPADPGDETDESEVVDAGPVQRSGGPDRRTVAAGVAVLLFAGAGLLLLLSRRTT